MGLLDKGKEKLELKKQRIEVKSIKALEEHETEFDRLLRIIEEKGKLTLTEAAKLFNTDKQKIEDWAKILHKNNLISLIYPAIGDIELRKPGFKEIKKEKKDLKKKKIMINIIISAIIIILVIAFIIYDKFLK